MFNQSVQDHAQSLFDAIYQLEEHGIEAIQDECLRDSCDQIRNHGLRLLDQLRLIEGNECCV